MEVTTPSHNRVRASNLFNSSITPKSSIKKRMPSTPFSSKCTTGIKSTHRSEEMEVTTPIHNRVRVSNLSNSSITPKSSIKKRVPSTPFSSKFSRRIKSTHCSEEMEATSSTCEEKDLRRRTLFDSYTSPKPIINAPCTPLLLKHNRDFNLKKHNIDSCQSKIGKPAASINSFTPDMIITIKRNISKRNLTFDNSLSDIETSTFDLTIPEDSDDEIEHATKHGALLYSNISRCKEEFRKLKLIGVGKFSKVYKCENRLDGRIYAIKISTNPIESINSVDEKIFLNKVRAHAVLRNNQHVVQYYSSWMENNRIIVQNEYCNGGSLADTLLCLRRLNEHLSERKMRQLLVQVAEGLRHIHSMHFVHLNIKPRNIFINIKSKQQLSLNRDFTNDGSEEEEAVEDIIYKIGNFRHMTSINDPVIQQSDCRYLSMEILNGNYTHLPKADIFALGLTVYQAGSCKRIPKRGRSMWQEIREGNLKELSRYSNDLNNSLKAMIHPDPKTRPSAISLIQHEAICSIKNITKMQLQRCLDEEKLKNAILMKQLDQAARTHNIEME